MPRTPWVGAGASIWGSQRRQAGQQHSWSGVCRAGARTVILQRFQRNGSRSIIWLKASSSFTIAWPHVSPSVTLEPNVTCRSLFGHSRHASPHPLCAISCDPLRQQGGLPVCAQPPQPCQLLIGTAQANLDWQDTFTQGVCTCWSIRALQLRYCSQAPQLSVVSLAQLTISHMACRRIWVAL